MKSTFLYKEGGLQPAVVLKKQVSPDWLAQLVRASEVAGSIPDQSTCSSTPSWGIYERQF